MGYGYDEQKDLEKPEAEQWLDAAHEARRLERQFKVTALVWLAVAAAFGIFGLASIPFAVVCGITGLVAGLVIARIWGRRHQFAVAQHAELTRPSGVGAAGTPGE